MILIMILVLFVFLFIALAPFIFGGALIGYGIYKVEQKSNEKLTSTEMLVAEKNANSFAKNVLDIENYTVICNDKYDNFIHASCAITKDTKTYPITCNIGAVDDTKGCWPASN